MRKQSWSVFPTPNQAQLSAAPRLEELQSAAEPEELLRRVALLGMAASMGVSTAVALVRTLFV